MKGETFDILYVLQDLNMVWQGEQKADCIALWLDMF